MLRALSTAATGMEAQQTKLDVTSNNIANVSTVGFKKSSVNFSDLMYQTERAAGSSSSSSTQVPAGTDVGLGTRVSSTPRMFTEGDMQTTTNPMDVAITGNGFFQVTLPTGEIAYSRNGSFQLDNEGKLVTGDGYPLSGDLTIPPEATAINIAGDGTVTATVPNETAAVTVGQIQLATFANPAGLTPLGNTLFAPTVASGTATTQTPGTGAAGTLLSGSLEMSNVNVVQEMVDLIAGQRAYEINSKVIKAADEMLSDTAQLSS